MQVIPKKIIFFSHVNRYNIMYGTPSKSFWNSYAA